MSAEWRVRLKAGDEGTRRSQRGKRGSHRIQAARIPYRRPVKCRAKTLVKTLIDIANLQPVTARSCSGLALIVDRDLGFLMWLGEVFSELGWQAVPALHCRQALALTKRLELPITTLVLNPELPGAARISKRCGRRIPGMRVVLIADAAANPHQTGTDAQSTASLPYIGTPAPWEQVSRPEWVSKVRRVLARGSE